jgi:hypothetical protein
LGAQILVATLKHPSIIGVYWEDNSRILGKEKMVYWDHTKLTKRILKYN